MKFNILCLSQNMEMLDCILMKYIYMGDISNLVSTLTVRLINFAVLAVIFKFFCSH